MCLATIHGWETHGSHDVGAWIFCGDRPVSALAQAKAGDSMHVLQTPQGETAKVSQQEDLTDLRCCVYPDSTPRPRPTKAIIAKLEEENRRLRNGQEVNSPQQPISGHTNASNDPPSVDTQSVSVDDNDRLSIETEPASWMSAERKALMPGLLFAEAARQRQMETVNKQAGSLDFDGVEPELGMHLLNLHWNRQHHSFLITYRPAFMRDMACQGPYFSKILLNAIYYAGWRFRERVRDLLGKAMDRSEITTIQALLQMTNSLFALGDEQSAAWLYAGVAFRMVIDLGLHVDATLMTRHRALSEEDLEIRRRIFWSAFVLDKIQSLYQGRPATLQHAACQVPISFNDTYEELEHWLPFAYTSTPSYTGSPAYSVSTFTELCKLCIILNSVLDKVYREKASDEQPSRLVDDLHSLESELETWSNSLPPHLVFNAQQSEPTSTTPPPHVLSLAAMKNVLRVLLHRPFVSDGHLNSIAPDIAKSSFTACATAATEIVSIVRVYDKVFSIRRAPYLMSYATYLAATIHVRIAAKRTSSSEAHRCLRTCLWVFEQNSETNYAVRKATRVIEGLMKRMQVSVSQDERHHSGQAASWTQHPAELTPSSGDLLAQPTLAHLDGSPSLAQEPTFVQGTFAQDLDIDAIIESFISGQGDSTLDAAGPSSSDMNHQAIHPSSQMSMPWPNFLPNTDDALFGFHSSTFEDYTDFQ
ncbi:hypothetical protein KC360_g7708 [Hortaea werneckii]|nr:hypothetical protein KC361_g5578 [Hortaea werneckii]KAI6880644.1 hypothetical protein KC325_g7087 [Hortaea werneckii]KAI6988923.1 hypothetical protein KC359_g7495 [Hortaea werneckii]KAI7142624.1 hypothetical protein KC344_g7033 [Hortaea werneckii]KAI7169053.1 hypothetical protein KC360_g7708 [Hortaea werneckii]